MKSEATTVKEYLAELPEDRKTAIETVRKTILERLPDGYKETMNWGMITYQVPLEAYPDSYNRKPLAYASLSSQKNYMAVYLMAIYMADETRQAFESAYKATGKRYDVGKSCVRFRKLEDLPLDVIGDAIAAMPMEEFIERVKQAHSPRK
jgi:ribosomal protein S7